MKTKKIRAYYYRSTTEVEDIDSTVQMQRLTNHAAKYNDGRNAIFADNGFSGNEARCSFNQMVALMRMSMLEKIVVTEPDRFFTELRKIAEFLGEANRYSVKVETVSGEVLTDQINTFSDALRAIFSVCVDVTLNSELELNRAWIYERGKENQEAIGEKNFVIDAKYFESIFKELFPDENDMDSFLDSYEPETDGEKIYRRALKDGKIKSEFISIGGKILSVNI